MPVSPRAQLRVSADVPAYGHKCPRALQDVFFLSESEKTPTRGAPACTGAPGVSRVLLPASLKMLLRSDATRVGTVPAPA